MACDPCVRTTTKKISLWLSSLTFEVQLRRCAVTGSAPEGLHSLYGSWLGAMHTQRDSYPLPTIKKVAGNDGLDWIVLEMDMDLDLALAWASR